MLEMKCKQCGESLKAKDSSAMFKAAKAHFKKEHGLFPVSDAQIKAAVQQNAKQVK